MRQTAKLAVIVVLFGQFGFSAAAYYLHVKDPSWPFWLGLYAISGLLAAQRMAAHRIATIDLYFLVFISYIVVSFVVLGESNTLEFSWRIGAICILPYICGRIVGGHASVDWQRVLWVFAFLYLVLLAGEVVRDPRLLLTDRPHLYRPSDWSGVGGDPTSFNIGITLGAAWVAAFAYLIFHIRRGRFYLWSRKKARLLGMVLVLPAVLLLFGSRSSVVSIVLSAFVLLVFAFWIPTSKKSLWISVTVIIVALSYVYLPSERKALVNDAISVIFRLGGHAADINACTFSGSAGSRVLQLEEAWRLFQEAPIFGIGASNFGLRYCGEAAEFASPHSLFAQVLVEYGLIGASIAAFLLIRIGRFFVNTMRLPRSEGHLAAWSLFGIWVFFLIQAQFIGNVFYDYHIFLTTGLLVSALYRVRVPVMRTTTVSAQGKISGEAPRGPHVKPAL